MAQGWIRLHRKALDSRVFSDDWLWRLWCWCLMRASWKETHILRGKRLLAAGQFACDRRHAAQELGVSPSKWYRGMQALAAWGQIDLKSEQLFTVVTICNWRAYQDEASESEPPVNHSRTTGEPPANRPSLREELKEGKNVRARVPPTPYPLNGTPAAQGEFAHFDLTAEGLAQAWCFYSTRRKLGAPRDQPGDMAVSFAELLRLGYDPQRLLDAILGPRDREELFWKFRERIVAKAVPAAETPADRMARVALERTREAEARAAAQAEAARVREIAERRKRKDG